MKQTRVVSLVVGAVLVAALIAGGLARRKPNSDYRDVAFQAHAVTLARGVHLLGELAPGAAYLVETSAGLVLIDAGLESDGAMVVSQIQDLGLDLDSLQAILLTHVHGDHSLGARRLRELTGARIYAGAGDRQVLESGEPREAFFSTNYMPAVHVHATEVDEWLAGGEEIRIGETVFHTVATPGHTPGSCCFWFERDGERILFTGDTVTSLTAGLGTYSAQLSRKYRGDAENYLASLQELARLPTPDLVLPGHPRLDRINQQPRLSRDEWLSLLGRGVDDLRRTLARFQQDGRDFLDGQPRELLPGLFYLGEFHEWAIYTLIVDGKMLIFDAPGGPELMAFIEERLQHLNIEPPPLSAVLLTASDKRTTTGLIQLVQDSPCEVVADAASIDRLRQELPDEATLTAADQWAEKSPFPVRVVPLGGLGTDPVAYYFTWHDKQILVSGRIPVRINNPGTLERLATELRGEFADRNAYLQSVIALAELRPDLWLPAHPTDAQNANLYGRDWEETLVGNQLLEETQP